MGNGIGKERWHVGKEIPIALIVTIAISVMSGIWYASKTDARITSVEEFVKTQSTMREDIVQIREQLKNLDRLISRIEGLMDRRTGSIDKSDRATVINKVDAE